MTIDRQEVLMPKPCGHCGAPIWDYDRKYLVHAEDHWPVVHFHVKRLTTADVTAVWLCSAECASGVLQSLLEVGEARV